VKSGNEVQMTNAESSLVIVVVIERGRFRV
jgi:hypothetical protein